MQEGRNAGCLGAGLLLSNASCQSPFLHAAGGRTVGGKHCCITDAWITGAITSQGCTGLVCMEYRIILADILLTKTLTTRSSDDISARRVNIRWMFVYHVLPRETLLSGVAIAAPRDLGLSIR